MSVPVPRAVTLERAQMKSMGTRARAGLATSESTVKSVRNFPSDFVIDMYTDDAVICLVVFPSMMRAYVHYV